MQLGAMNHPMRDTIEQIHFFRDSGFDFLDLTLEPEKASVGTLDIRAVRAALDSTGLGIVGHTAFYLPIASTFDSVREAALNEVIRCLDVFAELGVTHANLHPETRVPLNGRKWLVDRHIDSLRKLAAAAADRRLRLMLENLPGIFNRVDVLREVFAAVPTLGFHLDVAHANLRVNENATPDLLAAFADRLCHVHFSDNKGGDWDLHLPIGSGTIDWTAMVKLLKHGVQPRPGGGGKATGRHPYDGTITLEVFSADQDYLVLSGRKVRKLWDES